MANKNLNIIRILGGAACELKSFEAASSDLNGKYNNSSKSLINKMQSLSIDNQSTQREPHEVLTDTQIAEIARGQHFKSKEDEANFIAALQDEYKENQIIDLKPVNTDLQENNTVKTVKNTRNKLIDTNKKYKIKTKMAEDTDISKYIGEETATKPVDEVSFNEAVAVNQEIIIDKLEALCKLIGMLYKVEKENSDNLSRILDLISVEDENTVEIPDMELDTK